MGVKEFVDPIDMLFQVENLIEKKKGSAAASLCRTCLESGLREFMRIKYPQEEIENKNKYSGPGKFNSFLYDTICYPEEIYQNIQDILHEVGHKATHAVYKTDLDKAIHFYDLTKKLFETYLYPLMNISDSDIYQIRIQSLEKEFNNFHFVRSKEQLAQHLKLDPRINELSVKHNLLDNLLENMFSVESLQMTNRLIIGESGVGKSVLLYQFGIYCIENLQNIIAIPYYTIDSKSMRKLVEEYPKTFIILDNLEEYALSEGFFDKLKNNHLHLTNIVANCRLYYYNQIQSKHEFLNKLFKETITFEKNEKAFLYEIIERYTSKLKIQIDQSKIQEIKEMLVLKSEGLPLYIKEVFDDFLRKTEEGTCFDFEFVNRLPSGLINLISKIFYSTFIDVNNNVKNSRMLEFKILYMLSRLSINRFHHLFIEKLCLVIIKNQDEQNSQMIETNIFPQDYLIKSSDKYLHFSHSAWVHILRNYETIFQESSQNEISDSNNKILKILENTLNSFKTEKSENIVLMVKALAEAMNTPQIPLPIELWINALENFSFIYKQQLLGFFKVFLDERVTLDAIKVDSSNRRTSPYFEFIDSIRLNGRIFRDFGDFETANISFEIGLRLSKAIENPLLMTDFLIAKGISEKINFNSAKALIYYEEALSLANENDLDASVADIYHNIVNLYISLKDEKALEYIKKAEELYNKLEDSRGIANIEVSYGLYYGLFNEISKEREHYRNAVKIAEEIKDPSLELLAKMNLGTTYMISPHELKKAIKLLEESLEIAVSLLDFRQICTIKLNLGFTYFKLFEFGQALELINSIIEISKSLKFYDIYVKSLIQRARIYIAKAETLKAFQDLGTAEPLCIELGFNEDLYEINEIKMRYY